MHGYFSYPHIKIIYSYSCIVTLFTVQTSLIAALGIAAYKGHTQFVYTKLLQSDATNINHQDEARKHAASSDF